MAIYAAKAGMKALVLLPSGYVALGKVAQALMHGAIVLAVKGNFDNALLLIQRVCAEKGFYLLNSVNPYRLEGQKTIAFETIDQLATYKNEKVPDRVVLPVGNAGNISAIYKGFKEFRELDIINEVPMMTGMIRIGNPINAPKALRAIRQSNGVAESVTDQEILRAQKDLARQEGIGVEPASAASLAGLRKLIAQGTVDRDEVVVCVATGHLLKDPEAIMKACRQPIEVEANFDALYSILSELERS